MSTLYSYNFLSRKWVIYNLGGMWRPSTCTFVYIVAEASNYLLQLGSRGEFRGGGGGGGLDHGWLATPLLVKQRIEIIVKILAETNAKSVDRYLIVHVHVICSLQVALLLFLAGVPVLN